MTEKTPIIEFENNKELNDCLKWWQNKLMLNDWIITASVVDKVIYFGDDVCDGNIWYDRLSHKAHIKLMSKKSFEEYIDKTNDNEIFKNSKFCQEYVLVHELLHLIIPMSMIDKKDIPSISYEENQHQLVERLAKSYFMTKYNFNFDWFRNNEYFIELLED